MLYIRTKDENGIGCTFDQEAMRDYLLMWINESTMKNTIYILARAVLTWRDHVEDHNHHQNSQEKLRRKRNKLLVDGLRDLLSSLIVYADGNKRYKMLSEISRGQVEEVVNMPDAFIQDVLNHVNWKLKSRRLLEHCVVLGISDDPCLERIDLSVPCTLLRPCNTQGNMPSFIDVWVVVTTKKLCYVQCRDESRSIFDDDVFSSLEQFGGKNIADVVEVNYSDISSITLGYMKDEMILQLKSEDTLCFKFSRIVICENIFNELSRFAIFHTHHLQFENRTQCMRHDKNFHHQIQTLLKEASDKVQNSDREEHFSEEEESDGAILFSCQVECLARVHWFDTKNGGKLIGNRILCLTETHFLLFVDFNNIDANDLTLKQNAKTTAGDASRLAIATLPEIRMVTRGNDEAIVCHSRKDLIEFASDDAQQDAILYLGFNPVRDGDEDFKIGEGEEEEDMIFSEAQHHYTFTFQEYGSNGFVDVQKLVAIDDDND